MILDEKYTEIINSVINYLDDTQAPLEYLEGLQEILDTSNHITFTIPGHPIGKQRPRLSKNGIYTPAKTRNFELLVATVSSTKFKKPLESYLGIDIIINSKGKTSDIDNIAKAILDGLQGVAFLNDNQILELNIKLYKSKDKEFTKVSIYKLQEKKSNKQKNTKLIQEIIDEYHRILPELPKVRTSQAVKEKLKNRIRESIDRKTLNFWTDYFLLVRECKFLMGEQTDWHANLDWLLGKRNMSKVLNGLYLPTNGKNKIHNNNANIFDKLEREGFKL